MKKNKVDLNKTSRGILKRLFSRVTLLALLFLVQVVVVVFYGVFFYEYYVVYYWIDFILRFIALAMMVYQKKSGPYFTAWLIIILLAPIMGPGIYIVISLDPFAKRMRERIQKQDDEIEALQKFDEVAISDLNYVDSRYSGIANYLAMSGQFPTFKNNSLRYYKSGEDSLEDLLSDLRNAKKFIFLEFFIVKNGTLLQEILAILREKAAAGVEVKFLYDGFNAMLSLPNNYHKTLTSVGIETRVFSKQKTPFFHRESYRSHRKSIIIDGEIGYVGGVNLADEYVNRIKRFGYWKDAMMRIEGNSVNSITLTFLAMWDHEGVNQLDKTKYLIETNHKGSSENFVIPYSDCPLDEEHVGYNVYLEIISKATDYVYISSPYFVVDEQFVTALVYAGKRGVDVRILLPGIPDKKIPNYVAKGYYKTLVNAGIKIYEYTPGFNHAKMFVSDDVVVSLGSVNLDYRSFYLSYENSVFVYDKTIAVEIRDDLIDAFDKSLLIDEEEIKKIKIHIKILGFIFRLFSPLF